MSLFQLWREHWENAMQTVYGNPKENYSRPFIRECSALEDLEKALREENPNWKRDYWTWLCERRREEGEPFR